MLRSGCGECAGASEPTERPHWSRGDLQGLEGQGLYLTGSKTVPSCEVREERSRRYPAASVRDAITYLEQIHVGVGMTTVALPISGDP